ncbi:hypothetical protein HISP_00045 [Haloarcula hispanica N601]|uniref:Uncharacterized protein n=3 Tax=Haloarcula hispanica TaxID=51589 RepID=A0A482T315_HALHI|nr:hypothetical protein [Haloarcula hispanica]AEM55646.1 conserved hypothetical protein [Haloarcula hispanica ATCC 33960]AHB64470.1 hypothetical protein HISP_00045 [Haloarcula hispanica N601]KAA9408418.1 hypothetical protein EGO51_00935 [Haloarcula hispanica]MCJ0620400.1 hypothetical protein [Haloarcula hispanica]RYJ10804.1 hypothetical protein ELS20_12955 [Haloarcula hispanica]
MWRVTLTVAIALLAGCSGLFSAGSTADGGDPVTPAPVPTPSPDATVTVPTSNGTVDVGRLLDRHQQALSTRSFHRHVEQAGPQNTLDVWVDREREVQRVRRRFGPISDDVILANGTVYTNVRDDPDTPYATTPATPNTSLVTSTAGSNLLRQLLSNTEYRQVDSVQWNGRPVAVLAATDTVETPIGENESEIGRSRLYVDRQGVIRYVEHTERRPDRPDIDTTVTVTTDTERVPIPWWLEDSDPYDSGSM